MPETMTGRGPLRKSVKTTALYDRIAIRHGQVTHDDALAMMGVVLDHATRARSSEALAQRWPQEWERIRLAAGGTEAGEKVLKDANELYKAIAEAAPRFAEAVQTSGAAESAKMIEAAARYPTVPTPPPAAEWEISDMAIGFPNKSTRPEGRRSFGEAPNVIAREVVTPAKHGDGQDRDGTPAGRTSTAATSRDYADGAKYRNDLRGEISRGLTGGLEGRGTNPTVHSKNTKRYGRDGSRIDATFKSTGDQPASQHRDQLPPSWPPRAYTDRVPPGGISRRLARWGQPFVEASHATTRRHGSDGVHDRRASTDAAQGQAWHASGGQHGAPSPRRPSRDHAALPGATAKVRTSKLDKSEYVGGNKRRGPSTR